MANIQKRNGKFTFRWTDEHGNRLRETYDNHRDAKFALHQRKAEAEEIKRGLRDPAPPRKSVSDLCDYWIEKKAPLKRSYDDDVSIIRSHLRPALGHLELRDFSIEHVDTFTLAKLGTHSKKTVSNILTLLISILRVGKDLKWISEVPKIKKPKSSVLDYSYLTSADEIRRFLRAALEEGEHVHALYATAIWSGGRAGELAGLQWVDVDLEKRIITFRRSYESADGELKDNEIRHVPIFDPLLPILTAWKEKANCQIVFPNAWRQVYTASARVFQETLHRVLASAGFPSRSIPSKDPTKKPTTIHYVKFHDLRHTFASHWVMNDGSLYKLREMLGHSSEATTRRYAHLSPKAFAKEYGRFGTGGQTE